MNTRQVFTNFIIIFLLSLSTTAQTVVEDRIAFTTTDAPWLVMLDGENYDLTRVQVKPDGKSAYFLLFNRVNGLNVSLFIEPAVKCKTSEECRDFIWKAGNPLWIDLQNVVKSKIGDISYFEFFRPTVKDRPLQMFDMYAQFVENDYWVDLHISKALYKKEDHLLFENLVKSIKFVYKNRKPRTNSDKLLEVTEKTVKDWVDLWDAGKYEESYRILSSQTKKVHNEKEWHNHWTKTRKPLGRLKSRKLLRFQSIKSIPGLSGRSGAGLTYQSSFENKEKIYETFSISLEKDGGWKVAYYSSFE